MNYQVLGINDDQTTCDHCGKINLKKVVWLKDENGTISAVGETCAHKMASNYLFKRLSKAKKRYKALATISEERISRYAAAYGLSVEDMKKAFLMGELSM